MKQVPYWAPPPALPKVRIRSYRTKFCRVNCFPLGIYVPLEGNNCNVTDRELCFCRLQIQTPKFVHLVAVLSKMLWPYLVQNNFFFFTSFALFCVSVGSRDSSVGIATCYGLDGRGIESRWGRDFSHLSRPALGPTQSPIQCVPGFSPGGTAAGAWRWPPTPSSAEVKERVELCLYSPSGPSWHVLEWTLLLPELRFRVVDICVNHVLHDHPS